MIPIGVAVVVRIMVWPSRRLGHLGRLKGFVTAFDAAFVPD